MSTFQNVIIADNQSANSGGGIYCGLNSNPNTIMSQFQITLLPMEVVFYPTQNSQPVFSNSILWNDSPEEIISHPDSLTISFSNIQGGWPGVGNINQDPLFCMLEVGIIP